MMVTVDCVGFTWEAVLLGRLCPTGIFFHFSAFLLHALTCVTCAPFWLKRSENTWLSWLSSQVAERGCMRQHLVSLRRGPWRSTLPEAAGLACRCEHKDPNDNCWKLIGGSFSVSEKWWQYDVSHTCWLACSEMESESGSLALLFDDF